MKASELKKYITDGKFNLKLAEMYGENAVSAQAVRYTDAIDKFTELFGDRDACIFSTPGRSELSGNHTDHNHGCVVAGSVNIDIIAIAAKLDGNEIIVTSEGFGTDTVNIKEYANPDKAMFGTSASIIAGMCAYLAENGHAVGGFCAYTQSCVPKGSGLSSSAAFEDMIGTIENHFYNSGKIDAVEIAKTSQKAENNFFGKPCGLMDQVACSVGGIVAIDFKDPSAPVVRHIDYNLSAKGYSLCITNTGGNHADLTDDYASVPAEMKSVAALLGVEVLRDTDDEKLIAKLSDVREKLGDRAVLRAMHFFAENRRVLAQTDALINDNLPAFLENVKASGRSSFCYLQNIYTTKDVTCQGLSLALCLSERLLADCGGAWRVHGGGFAGTIQAFVPNGKVDEYSNAMNSVFGEGACLVLRIRADGSVKVL